MLLIKKLFQDAEMPSKSHTGDLGYDLYAQWDCEIYPGTASTIDTGIAVQLPGGYGGLIKDRSSIATKFGLFTVAGVIDNGYIGPLRVVLYNSTDDLVRIHKKQKIAQMVLIPVTNFEVRETNTLTQLDERGDGGFGSTDAK